jgi:uncharacterized protein YbjQ (UPF0145 family)
VCSSDLKGLWGSIVSDVQTIFGGEVSRISEVIQNGRGNAFARMVEDARRHKASGVAGVSSELREFQGHAEFVLAGSCVHRREGSQAPSNFFTTAGDAQDLFCHMDAGYQPIAHVFGNIAYSVGLGGGLKGLFRSLARGEVKEFSDIFNKTRHIALGRMVDDAKRQGANAVVGIRTEITDWESACEMLMTGTAAHHPAFVTPAVPWGQASEPVTSDLTGSELWSMAKAGLAPVKLLLSSSVYSTGLVGGVKAALRSLKSGEISEFSELAHDARAQSFDQLSKEADGLGAPMVVGTKVYIEDLGGGLIEFLSVGTAMTQRSGIAPELPMLPSQAIMSDRDMWVAGKKTFMLSRKAEENSPS